MSNETEGLYEFEGFRIYPVKRLLTRAASGEPLALTPKALDTLLYLVRNRERVVSKQELLDAVWPDTVVEENNLTQNVSAIRRALGEARADHRFVVTVPGTGYRWVAAVSLVAPAPADRPTRPAGISDADRANGASDVPEDSLVASSSRISDAAPAVSASEIADAAPGELVVAVAAAAAESIDADPVLVRGAVRDRPRAGVARSRAAASGALALAVVAVAAFVLFFDALRARTNDEREIRSLAVLPFKAIGAAEPSVSLGDGVTDAVIARLSNGGVARVEPTGAVLKYRGTERNPIEIGHELEVDAVLDGTVQRVGDQVRVTVQLLSVEDGRAVWAERFDEKYTHAFDVEDSISEQVASVLTNRLTGDADARGVRRPTMSAEAYAQYVKGRYFWNKRTPDALRRSIGCFEEALARDPGYALAHAGLADTYVLLAGQQCERHDAEAYLRRAQTSAEQALALDESLAEAHTALGAVNEAFLRDPARAEREYKRAIELNPDYPTAHQWYGEFLREAGRLEEAIPALERAQTLDPLSLVITTSLGETYYQARDYDRAIEQARHAIDLDPTFARAHYSLGLTLVQTGRYDEAIAELRRSGEEVGYCANTVAALGYTYGVSGRRAEALRLLRESKARGANDQLGPFQQAIVYAGIGDADRAIELLGRTRENKGRDSMRWICADPRLDAIRADPRFERLTEG